MEIKIKEIRQAYVTDAPLTTEEWDYLYHVMCEDQIHTECYEVGFNEMESNAREDNLVNILQALIEVKLQVNGNTDNLMVIFET